MSQIGTHRKLMAVVAVVAATAAAVPAQESTVEQLQELQELRTEVGRRRAELQRELRLLKQVLGEEAEAGMVDYEQSLGGMSMEEVPAELRLLREDLQRVRDQLVQQQLGQREERFAVSGEVRTRSEWNDADFTSGAADLVQLMRSRVRVVGRPYILTRVIVELQDGRLWGEETSPSDAAGDAIDFHQAYVELDEISNTALGISLGRQELVYGNGRVVGAPSWSNQGRAFDAVRLKYGGASRAELLYGKLKEKGVRDRNLYGLAGYLDRKRHHAEPYLLVEHDKGAGVDRLLRANLGLRADGQEATATGHVFGYALEGILQAGEAGGQDVLAYLAAASVNYSGPGWTRPRVDLGLDWLSGDDDPASGKRKAFDTLYGTRHGVLGLMDLFSDIPADTGQRGLADFYLKGEMSASEEVRLGLHVHHFALVEGTGNNLGQEADVVLTYQYNPACTVSWGGLIFVPSDAMKATRGEDPAFKTYLQTAVRF
ncbi:MAG: alginate export family protein [Gemmatimonadota bacterium]